MSINSVFCFFTYEKKLESVITFLSLDRHLKTWAHYKGDNIVFNLIPNTVPLLIHTSKSIYQLAVIYTNMNFSESTWNNPYILGSSEGLVTCLVSSKYCKKISIITHFVIISNFENSTQIYKFLTLVYTSMHKCILAYTIQDCILVYYAAYWHTIVYMLLFTGIQSCLVYASIHKCMLAYTIAHTSILYCILVYHSVYATL